MSLRAVKRKFTARNALTVAVATTSVTYELADIFQFPPARAATGILLLIFQTIQDIQSNRDECYRMAKRCLKLLTDLRDAMDGRWEDAPEPLLRSITKFEGTLQVIYDDLKKETELKWSSRLLRKRTIETALEEYNVLVDDAARSFQIATLIHLHHAIGQSVASSSQSNSTNAQELSRKDNVSNPFSDVNALCETPRSVTFAEGDTASHASSGTRQTTSDSFVLVESPTIEQTVSAVLPAGNDLDAELLAELNELDDKGFHRYHRSEVTINASSRIKSGWWAGGKDVRVGGRQLMMLSYDGLYTHAAKRWIKDVKTLQNVYHPNLPQMVGYSGTDAPTPFILLANVQTRLPQARVQDAIKNASLLDCARLLIRFYKDVFDAAIYLQRQLSLTDSKIQDYVENSSFRIERYDAMVMGLPPPEVYNMTSYRNFGLAHSIRDIFIQLIPRRGLSHRPFDPDEEVSRELHMKINHLGLLVRSIFPSGDDSFDEASSRLEKLLGDDDDEEAESLTLPMIRMTAILARTHGHSWSNNFCQAHQFAVGDIGYVPRDSKGENWKGFIKIGNVLEDGIVKLEVTEHATGWKTLVQHGRFDREELRSFLLPDGIHGWPLMMEAGTRQNVQIMHERVIRYVSDAWKTLLSCAPKMAEEHGIKPEELILIIRAGTDHRFVIHDTRHVPPLHPSHHILNHRPGFPSQFGGAGVHSYHHHQPYLSSIPGFGPPPPGIFYAFTSETKEHELTVSDSPVYLPASLQAQRPPLPRQCVWGGEGVHGFVNYVQLHEEDFQHKYVV